MQEYSSRRDPKDYNFGLDNPKLPNLRIQGRIWGMFKLGRVSAAGLGTNLNIPQILTPLKLQNLGNLWEFVWPTNRRLNLASQVLKIQQKDVWHWD